MRAKRYSAIDSGKQSRDGQYRIFQGGRQGPVLIEGGMDSVSPINGRGPERRLCFVHHELENGFIGKKEEGSFCSKMLPDKVHQSNKSNFSSSTLR